jgi:hypothetical protein
MFKFELGEKVSDVITGFTGIITGAAKYITGCNQYCIQPIDKKDKTKKLDINWFDENRLKSLPGKKIVIQEDKNKFDGGPATDCAPSK